VIRLIKKAKKCWRFFFNVWPCRSLIRSVVPYKFPNITLLSKLDNIYENDYRLCFTTSRPFVFLVLWRPRQTKNLLICERYITQYEASLQVVNVQLKHEWNTGCARKTTAASKSFPLASTAFFSVRINNLCGAVF